MDKFIGVCFTSKQTREERRALFDAMVSDNRTPEEEKLVADNIVEHDIDSELASEIARFYNDIVSKQKPLPDDIVELFYSNRKELYKPFDV